MNRSSIVALTLLALVVPDLVQAAMSESTVSPRGNAWWAGIAAIADDRNEGRLTGSAGYDQAAAYVIKRFRSLGLTPAGVAGDFRQPVAFERQIVDQHASTATLTAAGTTIAFAPGDAMLISAGGARRPATISAPMVFIGYGLHLPASGYDDLAGVDLKGKIAVVISGGPADLPGPAKAANRNERAQFLTAAGAVGILSIVTTKQIEIPWDRQKLLASQPGMYLAEAAMRDVPDNWFAASVDPAMGEALLAGSGHRFADLATIADASQPMPRYDLPQNFTAHVVAAWSRVTSANLIARLDGSDPKLRSEYIVISAHLDHLGIGEPINGKRIYNGAMDDASGVASVLDIAARLPAGARPKRSILFAIVTGEEKGLLGSSYLAHRPTVAPGRVVADLNLDMPLPLWPLTTIVAQGDHESTLGDVARAEAKVLGLTLIADPLPDRNSFVRTDQFSFVRAGIPALAFKFGFARGTPEFQIEREWRANRYHSPPDDLDQPGVLRDEAIKLDDYIAGVAARVADAPEQPSWVATSVFRPVAK